MLTETQAELIRRHIAEAKRRRATVADAVQRHLSERARRQSLLARIAEDHRRQQRAVSADIQAHRIRTR
ncbi:hypothetical protein CHELA20_50915 [Hyphomicrobiales bacterium]|nr:hypothetical protein CHELA20_50915 [Hyphomicrobiales bacterium]CAH1675373.1 hypothetical protein CHELA41_24098 [Hyphomicrobiales bacterium]